jgi:hypothetical protein
LEDIAPSVGTVGDAYDNALMESIIGLYMSECVRTDVFHVGPYRTLADVEFATAGWVSWYNNSRLTPASAWTPQSKPNKPTTPPSSSRRSQFDSDTNSRTLQDAAAVAQPCAGPLRHPPDQQPRHRSDQLLIEKTRRPAHGFRTFDHYRLRILLAASGQSPYRRPKHA